MAVVVAVVVVVVAVIDSKHPELIESVECYDQNKHPGRASIARVLGMVMPTSAASLMQPYYYLDGAAT